MERFKGISREEERESPANEVAVRHTVRICRYIPRPTFPVNVVVIERMSHLIRSGTTFVRHDLPAGPERGYLDDIAIRESAEKVRSQLWQHIVVGEGVLFGAIKHK